MEAERLTVEEHDNLPENLLKQFNYSEQMNLPEHFTNNQIMR